MKNAVLLVFFLCLLVLGVLIDFCCLLFYQLPADVLRLKERCVVTTRELALRLGTPHVAQIKHSCDAKVYPILL